VSTGSKSNGSAFGMERVDVAVDKRFVDKKPVTTFSLTKEGRAALVAHVRRLKQLLGE